MQCFHHSALKATLVLLCCLALCCACSKKTSQSKEQQKAALSAQESATPAGDGAIDTGPTGMSYANVPETAAEEVKCAAYWFSGQSEFEGQIGLVSKSDQIIFNGEPVDMKKAYPKTPASSSFDFVACGRYGYVNPSNLREFSVNRWTATNAACRLLEPAYLAKVRESLPQTNTDRLGELECPAFKTQFADASALESFLRERSHPVE